MNSPYRGIICIVQARCTSLVLSTYMSNNISCALHNESRRVPTTTPAQLMQRGVSRDLVAPDAGYQRYPGSLAGCYTDGFVYMHHGRGQANVAGHYAILRKVSCDGTPSIEHRG
ncbi:hypothetical protein ALC62_06450 [Cyphomyrmex costatus]|uniref:Uncharacterized protein n=1 Tax=Cyphomyrmex costatus TaxID=456900 RepID=A0A195CPL4_9HYME|nr:hypothetical protein ALC62_06450 [Cyphomyrmex costatus]